MFELHTSGSEVGWFMFYADASGVEPDRSLFLLNACMFLIHRFMFLPHRCIFLPVGFKFLPDRSGF